MGGKIETKQNKTKKVGFIDAHECETGGYRTAPQSFSEGYGSLLWFGDFLDRQRSHPL